MEESLTNGNSNVTLPDSKADISGICMTGEIKKGSVDDPYMMNGLTLAYMGDAVFEILVRQYMIANGSRQVDKLHKHTTSVVNAGMQSDMITAVMDMLTEKERSVYKRGRNSSTVTAAKHQSVNDYRRATGLEALFGYLYLNTEFDRLMEIFHECMKLQEKKKQTK